jgi:hypothetical protein
VEDYNPLTQLEYDDEVLQNIDDYQVVILSVSTFLMLSIIYTFLDLIVSLSVWSAASVGTPTDPKGRDTIMTSLIWIKVAFINLLLMCTFAAGIAFVVYGRWHNMAVEPRMMKELPYLRLVSIGALISIKQLSILT